MFSAEKEEIVDHNIILINRLFIFASGILMSQIVKCNAEQIIYQDNSCRALCMLTRF